MRRYTPAGMKEQAVARARRASTDAKTVVAEGKRLAADYRKQQSAAE
jgi:hypothetical protein